MPVDRGRRRWWWTLPPIVAVASLLAFGAALGRIEYGRTERVTAAPQCGRSVTVEAFGDRWHSRASEATLPGDPTGRVTGTVRRVWWQQARFRADAGWELTLRKDERNRFYVCLQ
jgi:hypothetical protein